MEGGELTAFELIVLSGFAIYRLSYLIAREEGPFSIFRQWRGRVDPNQSTWIGRGIRCPICISFWMSLVTAIVISLQYYDLPFFISLWLSLAGLAALFERVSK